MTNTVLLDNVSHQNLKVITQHSAKFADNINQVLIFPTEFEEVQREYPIFFSKDSNGDFQSVALLGLDKDENLFLGDDGWQARYIPAVLERGPFLIGFQEKDVDGEVHREPMIHVDLHHPRISDGEGQPLFLPHGGNTPYLEHVGRILQTIHQGLEVNKPMFAAFEELELIAPVEVEIKLSDVEQYNLPNYATINAEKLAGLDGASLERLNKAGFLRAAFWVMSSLGNVNRLIEIKNKKRAMS